ncbi:MAG: flotillin-like protein FloA [Pirellulales bacterium]|nr:flotillin-like protein FloA [Pirellulales bacterium]|tara:strand:+ start:4547 stop:5521 length:975 start_codon:yes stop_codon:yes gene_type:complete
MTLLAAETSDVIFWVVIGLLAVMLLSAFVFFMIYGKLWFRGLVSGANIGILEVIAMSLRQVNPKIVIESKIQAVQAGLETKKTKDNNDGPWLVSTNRLESLYLAGGKVHRVVDALVAAKSAGIMLNFDQAAAIDLAGRDVLEAVQTSVDPKVIDCPNPTKSGKTYLSAIAMDGVELKVRTRVTVRTNLDQLIGGATEDTIMARVGESIISSIGSAETHSVVLENPDLITKAVLGRGLDAQTAFEIVSIDIADVNVGENIGARLQADQAEADTRVARAKAEQRRAEAIATEQEMKAKVVDNNAKLILAEAEVPKAMAQAFREGNV